jgi:hypothetical protein
MGVRAGRPHAPPRRQHQRSKDQRGGAPTPLSALADPTFDLQVSLDGEVSGKHLSAYLDEMTFRFNDRANPYLFRDTLLKLIEAPVLEYKKLTSTAA